MSEEDFPTYGAYLRSKNLKVAYCRSATNPRNDFSAQKRWDSELDLYKSARAEGIQPATTKRHDIEMARRISDRDGKAYLAA